MVTKGWCENLFNSKTVTVCYIALNVVRNCKISHKEDANCSGCLNLDYCNWFDSNCVASFLISLSINYYSVFCLTFPHLLSAE